MWMQIQANHSNTDKFCRLFFILVCNTADKYKNIYKTSYFHIIWCILGPLPESPQSGSEAFSGVLAEVWLEHGRHTCCISDNCLSLSHSLANHQRSFWATCLQKEICFCSSTQSIELSLYSVQSTVKIHRVKKAWIGASLIISLMKR